MYPISVSKAQTLTGHKDCIYTLEKSYDNKIFFSGAGDGMVVAWNIEEPEYGQLMVKVEASVYAICYYPEKNALIVGQNYEGIHIIDVESKQESGSVKVTDAAIFDIKVFDDKIWVACGNGIIHILDFESLATISYIKASENSVRSLDFNPITRELAAGYSDNTIKIFDIDNYKLKKLIKAHKISVFSVNYSPDYKWLLSGSRDAHLKVWDVNQEYALKHSIVAHMYAINNIAYSPDGNYFVTCSMDKSIKIWDAKSFKLLKVIDKARHAGHGTSINKLLWSSYKGGTDFENPVISASDDRTISLWNVKIDM